MDVYRSDSPTLKVAGGFEFTHRAGPVSGRPLLEAMTKAYSFMQYDVALLTERESQALHQAGVTPPAPWKTHSESAFREMVLPHGKRVGFIVFPPLPEGAELPDDALLETIGKEVRKAVAGVDLLIGLSDWGIIAEREYLSRRPKNAPDILLGSGRGTGIRGQIMNEGRIFYARSYDKGKAINRIEILRWPRRHGEFMWISGENIALSLISLDNHYYDNLKINEIFSKVDLSNN